MSDPSTTPPDDGHDDPNLFSNPEPIFAGSEVRSGWSHGLVRDSPSPGAIEALHSSLNEATHALDVAQTLNHSRRPHPEFLSCTRAFVCACSLLALLYLLLL